ncbi:MAG: hypothetical protein KDA71_17975, partial [Planctomycetales bacterium]|nr:hypothetical protein [Planctomycetales bacterium]
IPPLRMNQAELTGFKKHPFYDIARRQVFLATRDGQPCGRILALVNDVHNQRYNEQRGFFGFFECIDDQQVANALFGAARDWLAAQGMTAIRGPANPSLNYECGLLIDGYHSSPTFMMTYNPPYYATLIEGYGFRKVKDMYAFYGHINMVDGLDPKLAFIVEEAKRRFQIQLRSIDNRRFDQDVHTFLDLYNKSLVGTWGFTPMTAGEIKHTAKALKMLIVPELTSVAEIDGRPVGASFGLLDYNPRIKKIDGRLFPFGFAKLLWNKRGIKRFRALATNVLPEFQRWGIGLVLLNKLLPDALEWGIQEAEFSWVLEDNHLSRASLERGGAKLDKTYRMYDYEIG